MNHLKKADERWDININKHSSSLTIYTNTPIIEFVFIDGTSETYSIGACVRGIRKSSGRPIKIKWYNCNGINITETLKKWVYEELFYVVDSKCFSESLITLLEYSKIK